MNPITITLIWGIFWEIICILIWTLKIGGGK
jgi:hypothetical protein